MRSLKILSGLSAILFLAGCFETTEEFQQRRTQFNGKTLAQVINKIGPPTLQDKSTAVWYFKEVHTTYKPDYWGFPGHVIPIGHDIRRDEYECKFTAHLQKGRVKSSEYTGNSCGRYSPRLPKKKP